MTFRCEPAIRTDLRAARTTQRSTSACPQGVLIAACGRAFRGRYSPLHARPRLSVQHRKVTSRCFYVVSQWAGLLHHHGASSVAPRTKPHENSGSPPKRGVSVFPSSAPSQARLSEWAEEGNTQKIINASTLACDAEHVHSVIAVKFALKPRNTALASAAKLDRPAHSVQRFVWRFARLRLARGFAQMSFRGDPAIRTKLRLH